MKKFWGGVLVVTGWRAAVAVACISCCLCVTCSTAVALGRQYEMVSPVYKGSYGVSDIAIAPSGETVAFRSQGTFAGESRNEVFGWYLASRGSGGWSTSPLEPPAHLLPYGDTIDVSPTLAKTLFEGCYAPNLLTGFADCHEAVFLEHGVTTPPVDEGFTQLGSPIRLLDGGLVTLDYRGASVDFCHLVVGQEGIPESEQHLTREAEGTKASLYQISNGCDGATPEIGLVGLNNGLPTPAVIDPFCSEKLGGYRENRDGSRFNDISADGQEIFFSAFVESSTGASGCEALQAESPKNPTQVFARLEGRRTLEISRPLGEGACEREGILGEVPCAGANKRLPSLFWGASEDGSLVFFATRQPLTGAGDTSDNLYSASIGCPPAVESCLASERQVSELVRVSQPASSSEAAEVQGVVRIAPDGSHVYFVARGVLSEEAAPPGRRGAVKGADNLYAYDSATGTTKFVAQLCSGPDTSGVAEDRECPSNLVATGVASPKNDMELWAQESETREAQVNVCGADNVDECRGEDETGRYLVFATYGRLLGADTDNTKDVYRYDSKTGAIARVSTGEAGADNNGNCNDGAGESVCNATIVPKEGIVNPGSVSSQHEMVDRAISEDGSRIVFTTAAPLSENASNGVANVYEWRWNPSTEGDVSIVSSGSSPLPDGQPVITPSGRDVFFITSAGLLGQDVDGMADVYDARLGGGFSPAPIAPEACEGEGCYGPLIAPVPVLVPASASQAPSSGGATAPSKSVKHRRRVFRKRMKHARTRRKARGSGNRRNAGGKGR